MKSSWLILLLGVVLIASGCASLVQHVGIALLYRKVDLPAAQVHYDLPYSDAAASPVHRLNLFVPPGRDWPVFVFVYGGGWTEGDKDQRFGGADVYGNIGRFYARHGIGVAVINYRLQPSVTWREQVEDVAQATAWVYRHIAEYGGNPQRIFIGGHSAGAQLSVRIALDPAPLKHYGLAPSSLSGVISVSGAGLDLADQKTYELGASLRYYQQRFDDGSPSWQKDASPTTYARAGAPPFLILYAGGEKKPLQRQSQRLREVLSLHQIPNQLVVVPGQSHARMVLALSRPDRAAAPAILQFILQTPRRPASAHSAAPVLR